jgi:hypothetical protein
MYTTPTLKKHKYKNRNKLSRFKNEIIILNTPPYVLISHITKLSKKSIKI